MLFSALAFLAGTCSLLFSPFLPDPVWQMLLVLVAVPMFRFRALRYISWIVLGYCWAAWQAGDRLATVLPADLQGQDIQIQGSVEGLPEQLGKGQTRFYFDVTAYRLNQDWQPLRLPVRLHWYRGALPMQPGEQWQLRVRLKQPHGFSNPGGFDYERWLFSRDIRATGYVKKSTANQRIVKASGHSVDRLRQHLARHLDGLDLPATSVALLRALTLGDRSGMSLPQWKVLQTTGTSHLLAISGLHVGLVAALVFAFSRRVWAWSGAARWWPSPRFAALAAMLAALAYALLAGFQVPAQRALIMIWVWMLAIVLNGRACPWQTLGTALWLILLLDPLAGLSAGFWLSFGAVTLIFYLGSGRQGQSGRIKQTLVLQAGLVTGLTPLLWLWFQQASWLALPANLVAIPWVGTLVVPLLLLGVALLPMLSNVSDALFWVASWLLDILWAGLDRTTDIPGMLWTTPTGSGAWLLACTAGLLVLLLPRAFRVVPLAAVLVVPALLHTPERPGEGDLWVSLLDVGQGLSVVLETRQHVLVYDAGPAFRSGYDTGAGVVAPFLRSRGYQQIDRLVVSHGDNDHRGGVASLLQQLPTTSVHSGDPAALESDIAEQCMAGQHWQWDQVSFEYLAPLQATTGNNGSCVLRVVSAGGRSILLTGDIEKPVEQTLLVDPDVSLSANVLVAPHHGSLSSSTPAFVERVHPEVVLFAVGYRNRFDFPRAKVSERYRKGGARLMNTADDGAIRIRLESGKPLKIDTWRVVGRRFWHHESHR